MFKDITLTWGGSDYVVRSDSVMRLICVIEDYITLGELTSGSPKLGKIAAAYAAALSFAGCKVTDQEVYGTILSGDGTEATATAVQGLLMMLVPPDHMQGKKKPRKRVKTKG